MFRAKRSNSPVVAATGVGIRAASAGAHSGRGRCETTAPSHQPPHHPPSPSSPQAEFLFKVKRAAGNAPSNSQGDRQEESPSGSGCASIERNAQPSPTPAMPWFDVSEPTSPQADQMFHIRRAKANVASGSSSGPSRSSHSKDPPMPPSADGLSQAELDALTSRASRDSPGVGSCLSEDFGATQAVPVAGTGSPCPETDEVPASDPTALDPNSTPQGEADAEPHSPQASQMRRVKASRQHAGQQILTLSEDPTKPWCDAASLGCPGAPAAHASLHLTRTRTPSPGSASTDGGLQFSSTSPSTQSSQIWVPRHSPHGGLRNGLSQQELDNLAQVEPMSRSASLGRPASGGNSAAAPQSSVQTAALSLASGRFGLQQDELDTLSRPLHQQEQPTGDEPSSPQASQMRRRKQAAQQRQDSGELWQQQAQHTAQPQQMPYGHEGAEQNEPSSPQAAQLRRRKQAAQHRHEAQLEQPQSQQAWQPRQTQYQDVEAEGADAEPSSPQAEQIRRAKRSAQQREAAKQHPGGGQSLSHYRSAPRATGKGSGPAAGGMAQDELDSFSTWAAEGGGEEGYGGAEPSSPQSRQLLKIKRQAGGKGTGKEGRGSKSAMNGNTEWHSMATQGLLQDELDVLSRPGPPSPGGPSDWGFAPGSSQGDDSPQARHLRRARRTAAAARQAGGGALDVSHQGWQQAGGRAPERHTRQQQACHTAAIPAVGGHGSLLPSTGRQVPAGLGGLSQTELDALAEVDTQCSSPLSSQVTPHTAQVGDTAIDFGGQRCGSSSDTPPTPLGQSQTIAAGPGLSQAELDALSRPIVRVNGGPAPALAGTYNGAPSAAVAAAAAADDGEPVSPQANQMRRAKRATRYAVHAAGGRGA